LGDDIDGEDAHDFFRYCVAISGDGRTIAAEEPLNDRKDL
jgi:hypothetical protein